VAGQRRALPRAQPVNDHGQVALPQPGTAGGIAEPEAGQELEHELDVEERNVAGTSPVALTRSNIAIASLDYPGSPSRRLIGLR
jgi:hypothetical protein